MLGWPASKAIDPITLALDIRAKGTTLSETALAAARSAFDRIIVEPTPADLWQLQKALLVIGSEPAARARTVARAFHACLRNLESKSASRTASRWGAVLGTAAVGSVSLGEMGDEQEDALRRLLQSALPAVLEIGSALKSAQAWEVEAGLLYDDLAWFLYDELWDISGTARPDLSPSERRDQIELLLDPLARLRGTGRRPGGARGQRLPRGARGASGSAVRPTAKRRRSLIVR